MARTAHEMFWQSGNRGVPAFGDKEAIRALSEAASSWRRKGKYFSAAYAMQQAAYCAMGDLELWRSCATKAMEDYLRCIDAGHRCSHESLAALKKSALLPLPPYFSNPVVDALLQELAERLVTCYVGSPHIENYLVRGVILKTDLKGNFTPLFPDHEVDWATETCGSGRVLISLPSAFHLFIHLADYEGAQAVVERCPGAFTTPSLRGWKAAVGGFLRPEESAISFQEAAAAFAEDRSPSHDELALRGGSWTSINIDLWSPYFRARSAIACVMQEPTKVREFVQAAAQVVPDPSMSGWHHPQVARFAILVRALAQLTGSSSPTDLLKARDRLVRESGMFGAQPGDELSIRFLNLTAEGLEGFQADPIKEFTSGRLHYALEALERIPLLVGGPDLAHAVMPLIGAQAQNLVFGPVRTSMHRTLEDIRDERQLQRIILRLAQHSLPLYAQILHGPQEYGRDVVVLLEVNGERILRMYQVKVGNITTAAWRRARDELAEMFLVPLPDFIVPADPPPSREGILVCNGHALPQVVPVMEGWFQEQKRDHDRELKFMHLDCLVHWIMRDRLVNEFKVALKELGIPLSVS